MGRSLLLLGNYSSVGERILQHSALCPDLLRILDQANDAQAQAALVHVNLEHFGADQGVDFVEFLNLVLGDVRIDFRDVNEPFHALHHLHEDAEIGHVDHPTDHLVVDVDLVLQVLPRVFGQLLDAQGQPLLIRIDVENLHFDLVALLGKRGRFALALTPGEVGNVNQSVDAFLEADEDAKVGDIAHLAPHDAADRMFEVDRLPGIGLGLLDG